MPRIEADTTEPTPAQARAPQVNDAPQPAEVADAIPAEAVAVESIAVEAGLSVPEPENTGDGAEGRAAEAAVVDAVEAPEAAVAAAAPTSDARDEAAVLATEPEAVVAAAAAPPPEPAAPPAAVAESGAAPVVAAVPASEGAPATGVNALKAAIEQGLQAEAQRPPQTQTTEADEGEDARQDAGEAQPRQERLL